MSDLHWFSDITWDTSMRDIGWTYVLLIGLIIFTGIMAHKIYKDFK